MTIVLGIIEFLALVMAATAFGIYVLVTCFLLLDWWSWQTRELRELGYVFCWPAVGIWRIAVLSFTKDRKRQD